MPLDPEVKAFASDRNFAALTTLFEDGAPQTNIMWVDADDDHILINTEVHRAKFANIERDPRVAVAIWDAESPYRFVEIRGRVTEVISGPEARAHIDACAQRYMGRDYPAENITSERAILRITPDRVNRRGM